MLSSEKYTLMETIHEGPETIVYRGRRAEDGARVAIKILKDDCPSPAEIERLGREHVLLKGLDVRGIPRVLGLEQHGGRLALVMEELSGRPLDEVLRSQRLELRTALQIGASLAGVLERLHHAGVIHKDVKPQNVLVDLDTGEAMLVDLGAASRVSSDEREPSDIIEGTLAYASPEQTGRMNRRVDHRTDLYSLGVSLYEMLTSTLPFTSTDPMELVHSHVARMPVAPEEQNPSLPRVVSDIVMKLLSKAAEDRYRTAAGLQADLAACLGRLHETGRIEPFPLGQRDEKRELRLPRRLYGRDAEREVVRAAWERVRGGASELLLLTGPAGVGKSALVDELRAEVAPQGGYFIAGKFDQLQRSVPYAPLEFAFRELVRRVLTEPRDVLDGLRTRLVTALGPNGRVITDIVPDVALIIGPQPAVPALGPTEAQNRFNLVFQRFIGAFTAPQRPLTVFLDDLQWADPASLKLLCALLTDPESAHLLVLGAYRDGEVDDAHPLSFTLAQLRKSGSPVSAVPLAPLAAAEVTSFVADTLECGIERAAPLAVLLREKTDGNPFFIGQVLLGLFQDGIIQFDAERGSLVWDLDAIRMTTGDDVVAFMTDKLRALSPTTQHALELAACMGHRFDVETLSVIVELPPAEVRSSLEEALGAGLLLPIDPGARHGNTYRFLHDRIQQAAYALIGEAQRREVHLRIGRLLRARLGADPRDEELFAVVHHENLGAALITDASEQAALLQRNVSAGRKAKAAMAYEAAAAYFENATSLLDEASWERDHGFTFGVHAERAECEYLCGRFESAEVFSLELLPRATSVPERMLLESRRMGLRMTLSRYADAVEIGRAALATVGIHLPATEEEGRLVLADKLGEVASLIGDRQVEELVHERTLDDPDVEAILQTLMDLGLAGYYVRPTVYACAAVEQVILSLRHGHSAFSAVAYMAYAFIHAALLGQYERAEAFGELALAVRKKFPHPQTECKVHHMFGTILHFRKPIRVALAHLTRACSVGLEHGDFVYLSAAADNTVPYKFALGMELAELRKDVSRLLALMQRTKDALSVAYLSVARQLVANLEGRTLSRFTLSGDGFEEAGFPEALEREGLFPLACWFYVAKLVTLFLHGDDEGALEAATAAEARVMSASGQYFPTELAFFACLAAAARRPKASPDEARRCDEILARNQEKLAQWSTHCPANYRHKYLLIVAEVARLEGKHDEATDAFDRAIAAARAEGFSRDEAIAAERCARFHLEKGRQKIARVYMTDAYAGYVRWGATAKTADLAEQYADLLPAASAPPSQGSAVSVTATGGMGASGLLDAAALVRAAQALVSEVVLERVLERLVRLVVENAGAQRGVLLLAREGELLVAARLDRDHIEVGAPIPITQTTDIASTIVRYVARTFEPVVLDDATHDHRFAADPYLTEHHPRSVLCLAMTQNERLTGVFYLENNVASAVFTRARIHLAGLLASLAATAVGNALLYAHVDEVTQALRRANESLENEVARRTEDLRASNVRLEIELSERERAEQSRGVLHEQIIRMQEDRLAELSTPILPITDRIVVMPLIGTMDARRGKQVLDAALSGVRSNQAEVVILDVTGMKLGDVEVADMLTATANALRLLGARAIVTGLSPEVARTLVERGAGLGSMVTTGTLKAAVAHALRAGSVAAMPGNRDLRRGRFMR